VTRLGTLAFLARLELSTMTRRRWVRLFSVAFALLASGVAWSAGTLEESGGPEGFARTTVALVPLVLMVAPLAALLVGITGQGGEAGGEAFLFTLPLSRSQVLVGRWLGELAALGASVGVGFAAGAFVVAMATGVADGLGRFAIFAALSLLLVASFLSLAALVAVVSGQRTAALGVGAFVWFAFVILHDTLAFWGAGFLGGRTGARLLFASVLLNPVDTARVAILSLAGTPHVLGAAGEAWQMFLGGAVPAALVALGVLAFWIVAPLEAARRLLARRDLYS
jgi:Cu-processing system permease protein